MIEEFYGDRKAVRSGVPLINHINEGTRILIGLGALPDVVEAYRLHPMFQNDDELFHNRYKLLSLNPYTVMLLMEYRNTANSALSDIVYKDYQTDWCPLRLRHPIKTSPIDEVNKMLIADKVQNWKDFKIHHLGKHERSEELDYYFRSWFRALGISEGEALFLERLCTLEDMVVRRNVPS